MEASDASVWVAVSRQRKLYRLDPEDGPPRGRADRASRCSPRSVAVTSRSVWVGLLTDRPARPTQLAQLDRRTGRIAAHDPGARRASRRSPPATAPSGSPAAAARSCPRFDPRKLGGHRAASPVGSDRPFAIAFGAGAVWVASPQDDLVTRIDPGSYGTIEIGVGRNPRGVAVRGQDVFVANKTDNTVTRIDARGRAGRWASRSRSA